MGIGKGSYSQPSYTPPDMSGLFDSSLQSYKSSMDNTLAMSQMSFQQQLDNWTQSQELSLESTPNVSGADAADTDWKKKQEELKKKMEADYTNEKASMVGRLDNILSSPLLDTILPETTSSSLLAGK